MKRTRLRKQGKSEFSRLVRENDVVFREILRIRDKVCQMTGATNNLQVAHYISRSVLATRWDENNCILAKAGINLFWMPKYRTKYRDFMIQRIGLEMVERLEWKERKPAPMRTSDLEVIKICLKARLEQIKRGKR